MSIDPRTRTDREDKPLTRADVERLLHEAGSPDRLNLSSQNLSGISLSDLNLAGANLHRINLKRANLYNTDLTRADLSQADLSQANLGSIAPPTHFDMKMAANLREANLHLAHLDRADLTRANLSRADLSNASLRGALLVNANLSETNLSNANLIFSNLSFADLSKADLSSTALLFANLRGTKLNRAEMSSADLRQADLSMAKLNDADLTGANLSEANLHGADLSGADLTFANLNDADLTGAILIGVDLVADLRGVDLTGAYITEHQKRMLRQGGIEGLKGLDYARISATKAKDIENNLLTVEIRIMEEPLTAQNLATVIVALTELYTKCWLIQQNHLSDLIDYTQTHDPRFSEEANLVIAELSHNSPAEIKLDIGIKDIAESLRIGIDSIAQASLRYEEAKLKNQAEVLEMKLKEEGAQSAYTDKEQARQIEAQRAELEKQKAQLEIEKQRLELQEKRLDLEKKRIDFALETASKMVNMLRPDADAQVRIILIQTLLPDLLQLGNSKGLELALPVQQINGEEGKTENS